MSMLKIAAVLTGGVILFGGMSMTVLVKETYALTKVYQDYTFTYTAADGKAVITGCKGEGESLVIPETLDGYKVTEIADKAFSGLNLFSSVTIPSGVEIIGERAFYDCSLVNNITIPDSVTTIKDGAFLNCKSLQTAEIGAGLKNVGMYIFGACPKLYSIAVHKDNKNLASSDNMLVSYDKKSLIQYAGVNTEVEIPDYVTSVMGGAFFGLSNIKKISIPDSVTEIAPYAFSGCLQLESIEIPDSVKTIGNACFMNCTGLKSVTLGKSVTKLAKQSFSMCSSLSSIKGGISLASIEEEALYGCSSLKEIVVPMKVTEIASDSIGMYYDLRTGKNLVYSDVKIIGAKGSAAEKYAESAGIEFQVRTIIAGDINGDNSIDAVDASSVLAEYAKTSTGEKSTFDYFQWCAADFNSDNNVDAVDASMILSQYAKNATS